MTSIPTTPDIQPEPLGDHDSALVVRSLRDKAARLEKVAETVRKEGYPKSAQVLTGDAKQIVDHIIPDLDPQGMLVGLDAGEARATVGNAIAKEVTRAVTAETPIDPEKLQSRLQGRLTDLLYPAMCLVYLQGRSDGDAQRAMQDHHAIVRAINEIKEATD